MLGVGQESYISVVDADAYVARYYRSTSKVAKRWAEVSEPDKEILLRQACAVIEHLPFPGQKSRLEQLLAWPRLPQQYGMPQLPPQAIIFAQVELALSLSDDDAAEGRQQRKSLQADGVKSFSIGDLAEGYELSQEQHLNLAWCPKAYELLKPYLGGGYELR